MKNWLVLYTKPRMEKKVASQLEKAGFVVYLPLIKTVRQWSDRKKRISMPLFNAYIFIYIEESQRDHVFQVPGVVRFLFWLGKPAIVRPEEIANIKDFLNEHDGKHIRVMPFSLGQKVKVINGPLAEHFGRVQRLRKNRVILNVESLGMTIHADVHHSQLAKA